MKKALFKKGIITGIAILGIAVAVPLATYAEESQGGTPTTTKTEDTTSTTTEDHTTQTTTSGDHKSTAEATLKQRLESAKENANTRLTDTKLKMCQAHEKDITKIMGNLADRGQKQLTLFSTIAERTEKFYTEKGKTLSNYDTLVADVNAKKTAAQTAIDTVKSTTVEFKCDGTDPKGVASSFKTALKAEIAALKAYKTSVKNLIVGVKSVQSTTTSGDSTPSNDTTTSTNKETTN